MKKYSFLKMLMELFVYMLDVTFKGGWLALGILVGIFHPNLGSIMYLILCFAISCYRIVVDEISISKKEIARITKEKEPDDIAIFLDVLHELFDLTILIFFCGGWVLLGIMFLIFPNKEMLMGTIYLILCLVICCYEIINKKIAEFQEKELMAIINQKSADNYTKKKNSADSDVDKKK